MNLQLYTFAYLNIAGEKLYTMTKPKVSFQLILDSKSILFSSTPDGKKLRANITELDASQIERIVEGIQDAGPEAYNYLINLVRDSQ